MKTIGNIIWLIFGGLFISLGYFLSGIILCLTIIFIPWGIQCFKIGKLAFAPFGKEVDVSFDEHPVSNIIWMLFFGWEAFASCVLFGVICCLTIIFIPFGKQWFKLGKVMLLPFGADID